ncbi:phosphate transport system regulatory protein PhoU [Bacillus sp. FJAT-27225]|uniref:phosphate signaling complex protein PhoU n=1 Tax=Bacillus sp. FJAT-27225 TaxID=1743144 RepID=UPI00080C2506|nr:phosphate signaling complex protein PhoU [Bacillus sp. FJAT-27225]OCA91114.1 phosphate transport system regulatory protein PhoU [Bacillus sp. FJAT-27225]
MVTRTNFDNNLNQLKEMLMEMVRLSTVAVREATEALVAQDLEKANGIVKGDTKIDELEAKINEKAILLIATESPVATDLRKIIAALKISSEVERIADNAVNIAKAALHIGKEKHIKEIVDIPKMMILVIEMLECALKSFYENDTVLARECAKKDDKVDEMYGQLVSELLSFIPKNPTATNQITQLAYTCRYLERIGDHSTNISEQVIYVVTGKLYDLNT